MGKQRHILVITWLLLISTCIKSLPLEETTNTTTEHINYNCPTDCHCVIPEDGRRHFLHAKCNSILGLKSAISIEPLYPIHSIDLSHLGLPRLSHALEKLINITSINLSHNELHEIGHLGRRIKKLNLKHNRITSNKLRKLPQHLVTLNLQYNDISYLPLELMQLNQLSELELAHNDINCSCETLEVRDWLENRQIFMEEPVICSYPIETKGKPWLQIKKSDICEKEKQGNFMNDEENELLQADEPIFEGSAEEDDVGALKEDFLLAVKAQNIHNVEKSQKLVTDAIAIAGEGSGDDSDINITTETALLTDENDDDEASGSGGGPIIIPHVAHEHIITDDDDDLFNMNSEENQRMDDLYDTKPIEEPIAATPPPEILVPMHIFEPNMESTTSAPILEPVVHQDAEIENVKVGVDTVVTDSPEAISHANVAAQDSDSNGTYLLLGLIVFIILGLMLFVGVKRCKKSAQNRYDAESARQTELLDMDKGQLGKPLRNGNEHAPLIGEQTKVELAKSVNGTKKPYDAQDLKDGAEKQLINGNGVNSTHANKEELAEKEKEPSAHEYYPITPRYPTPKSPRASKYAQYPPPKTEHNNNIIDDAYLPASPKSGRYSPVYSPETGRVKIKLTETPKPKTPMLVTRSKSNAGDIITTPVHVTHEANGHLQH